MSDFYEIRNAQSLKYFQYPSTKVSHYVMLLMVLAKFEPKH